MDLNPSLASDIYVNPFFLSTIEINIQLYILIMSEITLTWHKKKNAINIEKHGIDFVDITKLFDHPIVKKIDARRDYGEERWIGLGRLETIIVVVIYTIRNGVFRIISARRANHHERKIYCETFKEQNKLG